MAKSVDPIIIPTPRERIELDGDPKSYAPDAVYNVVHLGDRSQKILFGLSYLKQHLKEEFGIHSNVSEILSHGATGYGNRDIIVCSNPSKAEEQFGVAAGTFFDVEIAREQGYILENVANKPVVLVAATDQGCLHAMATLLELFIVREGRPKLDLVRIEDYPEFRYRGVKWTIWAELGVWSYDWGDGIEAFDQRTIEKLDMAFRYKINMIIFDGCGWDVEIFPEYASLMKELNREARLRGISLIFTGQSSGFCHRRNMIATDIYRGEVLENRKSYPDGESYVCIGGEIYAGTCLSNSDLVRRNMESIVNFVASVEPSALYVHQLDVLNLSQSMWDSRCPECRKRWPDDALDSESGMAGAYAEYYSELMRQINGVRSESFDAAYDCLVMIVSPGYLDSVAVEDEDWDLALRYWSLISKLMAHRENQYFGFREMFFNHGNDRRRISELKNAMDESGNGHHVGIIHFYGGDGWQSEQLFLPTPALNYVFTGADMLLTASGHAFQEAQQLFNAEFMWNPRQSDYRFDSLPENFTQYVSLYNESRSGSLKPAKIYGEGGFLEIACSKLYGAAIGPLMAEVNALRGKSGTPPVPYLRNKELNTTPGPDGALQKWIGFDSDRAREDLVEAQLVVAELHDTTDAAKKILDRVDVGPGSGRNDNPSVHAFKSFLATAVDYISLLVDYVAIYMGLVDSNALDSAKDRNPPHDEIESLSRRIELVSMENEHTRLVPVDYLEGALSGRRMIIRFLTHNLNLIRDYMNGVT